MTHSKSENAPAFFIVEPCTTSSGFEIKFKDKKIDLKRAEDALSADGWKTLSSSVVLMAMNPKSGISLSVYASGRIMIKSEKKQDKKEAEDLAATFVPLLERSKALLEP